MSEFVSGTATPVGTTTDIGGTIITDSLFIELAENVIVGVVTENTVMKGEDETNKSAINDGTFTVQGADIHTV